MDETAIELAELDAPALLPWVNGEPGVGAGTRIIDVNPATGLPIARVACADPAEIDQAIQDALFAAKLWRSAPFEEKARRLIRLAACIREQSDAIAGLIALEQGKPIAEALALEVLPCLDHLRFLVRHGRELSLGDPIEPRPALHAHKKVLYIYDPLGVVVLVTSFSMPFAEPLVQAASAMAMGNAVILKPSELTPLTALRVGELCAEAGFPAGLINVIPATAEDTARLIAHDGVAGVFVTPSVGETRSAKHSAVVAADADVARAARGIVWGAMANAGQTSAAVGRVFVEDRVASRFVEAVFAEVDAIRSGDPTAPDVELGPLVSDARRVAVHEHVTEAVLFGARLARGGVIPEGPGFFYPPTVILDPPEGCRLLEEATAGPVIPIVSVDSLEQAIHRANSRSPAPAASGWTASEEVAERLLVALQAEVVTINDVPYAHGDPLAVRSMTRRRFVSHDNTVAEAPAFAFPYGADAIATTQATMDALHAPTRLGRVVSFVRLLRRQRFRARLPWRSFLLGRR